MLPVLGGKHDGLCVREHEGTKNARTRELEGIHADAANAASVCV